MDTSKTHHYSAAIGKCIITGKLSAPDTESECRAVKMLFNDALK